MYVINITNNYGLPLKVGSGTIDSNQQYTTGSIGGTCIFEVPGIGQICVIDLGETKLDKYPFLKETWGVLIRYQGIEVYSRYEHDGGIYNIVVDLMGEVTVTAANGNAILISLPGLILTNN